MVAVASCYTIEKAIKDLFCSENSPMQFKAIDVQSGITALSRPGFTVAVTSGNWTAADNSGKLEEEVSIVVTLVLKNVANEEERRKLAHPAVKYVVQKLHKNDLGLDMEPLTAQDWKEVTSPEHLAVNIMVVELNFKTQFTVTPDSAVETLRDLLSISSTFKSPTPDYETLSEATVITKEVNNVPDT